MSPFLALVQRIRETRSQYTLTDEEKKSIISCRNSLLVSSTLGLLGGFSSVLVLSRSYPITVRAVTSVFAGVLVSRLMARYSERECLQKILELNQSAVSGELLHILRENYPNHRALLWFERQKGSKPLTFVIDDGNEATKRLPLKVPYQFVISSDGGHHPGENVVPNAKTELMGKISVMKERQKTEKEFNSGDEAQLFELLVDPMSLLISSSHNEIGDETGSFRKRVQRKSRLTNQERREYNRRQYAEWLKKEQLGHSTLFLQ